MDRRDVVVGQSYSYQGRTVRVEEKPDYLRTLVKVTMQNRTTCWVYVADLCPLETERPSAAPGPTLTFSLTETQAEDVLRALEDRVYTLDCSTVDGPVSASVPAAIGRMRALAATFRARLNAHPKAAE